MTGVDGPLIGGIRTRTRARTQYARALGNERSWKRATTSLRRLSGGVA